MDSYKVPTIETKILNTVICETKFLCCAYGCGSKKSIYKFMELEVFETVYLQGQEFKSKELQNKSCLL